MKKAKLAYLHSLLALLVCISLFVGTTFAWFTDSVSSVNNIIKSGNLDLEMYWTDDLASGTWYNVEDPAYNTIFSYDNWEPGYTDVKYIKIVNKGSLAFKYQLAFTPVSEVGKLAEVISVYYGTDGTAVAGRDLTGLTSLGFLANIMNGGATASGVLLPKGQTNPDPTVGSGEAIVTVAMSMLTTAGNEYQLQTAGDFTVTAMATQVENEFDSFGNDYDHDSEWPQLITASKGEVAVTPVNGVIEADVSINAGDVTATVPAGVKVADGVDKLTLTTTPLENTTSDITPSHGEILMPIDVHVEGIAEDNTTPIIIDLGAVLPTYLNMGNYSLYHVEDGVTNEMNLVDSKADLADHNDYTYDPATGNVSVALASFSEVALLAKDTTYNVWNGGIDVSWYVGHENDTSYTIYNADQMNGLAYIVSGQPIDTFTGTDPVNFSGKIITLARDIDFDGENGLVDQDHVWYPIGLRRYGTGSNGYDEVWYDWGGWFAGTFDGNGHTVKGIYQRTWDMDGNYEQGYYKRGMGLFAGLAGESEKNPATVKNLTIEGFQSDGEFTPTGCIAAYGDDYVLCENIRITNCNPRVYNTGNGGLIGWDNGGDTPEDPSHFTFKNVTVDSTNKITALWGSWDVACGGILGYLGESSTAAFENCNVSATIDVYNDVCANYQYYWYRYAGMYIGTVDRTDETGKIDLTGITAKNCKANFGDRHEYYYCEFVKNSIASYTHDYQMSRITHAELDWNDDNNDGIIQASESSSVRGCVGHNHDEQGNEVINGQEILVENNQAIYLPFRQLFGTYGWGTRGISLDEYNTLNPDKKIEIAIEGSDIKFALNKETLIDKDIMEEDSTNFTLAYANNANSVEIRLGDFFKLVDNVNEEDINADAVFASASALVIVDDKGNVLQYGDQIDKLKVKSEFIKSTTGDWRDGVLKIYYELNNTGEKALVEVSIQDYANCEPTVFRAWIQDSKDNNIELPNGWLF